LGELGKLTLLGVIEEPKVLGELGKLTLDD